MLYGIYCVYNGMKWNRTYLHQLIMGFCGLRELAPQQKINPKIHSSERCDFFRFGMSCTRCFCPLHHTISWFQYILLFGYYDIVLSWFYIDYPTILKSYYNHIDTISWFYPRFIPFPISCLDIMIILVEHISRWDILLDRNSPISFPLYSWFYPLYPFFWFFFWP